MASIFRHRDKWRAQIRRAGHPTMSEVFDTKSEAQKWVRQKDFELDQIRRVPVGLRVSVADLIDAYLGEMKIKSSKSTKLGAMKRLKRELGHYRLEELNKRAIINFVQVRENAGIGPATIKADLSYLGTVLRYGGAMIDAEDAAALCLVQLTAAQSVLRHSKRIAASKERDRRPTDEELEWLEVLLKARLTRLIPYWKMVMFAIATAMRLGEITRIRWEDFDEKKRTIIIRNRKDPQRKEGNDQVVPLLSGHFTFSGKVIDPVEIILSLPKKSDRIFPYSEKSVSTVFARMVRDAGIDDLHFHDLRHDAVSRLFEAGHDIPQVSQISGHKTWRNLARYTNLRVTGATK